MGMCGCCSASAIDPKEAENQVRGEAPGVVMDDEEFLFAFAYRYDQVYLTTVRILIKDKEGTFGGGDVTWKTIPYGAIKAFYVETADFLDPDLQMVVYASGLSSEFTSAGMPSSGYKISFRVDGGVDIFALQSLLNQKVFSPSAAPAAVAPQPEDMDDSAKNVLDAFAADANVAVNPKMVEARLKSDPPVLLPDEVVDMAFTLGMDACCFTNRRILNINRGLSKKVSYHSLPWSSVVAFAVETAGWLLDRDCELKVWSSLTHIEEHDLSMDLRNSSTDVLAIQRYLADRVLGQDTAPPAPPSAQPRPTEGFSFSGMLKDMWNAWLDGSDSHQVDAAEAERRFKEEVPVLQGCEKVDMAFKGGRDMILFTTKRLVRVDVRELTGEKKEVKSYPWACIQAFALQSAAGFGDFDAEMMIWTSIYHSYRTEARAPENGDGDGGKALFPEPGESFFSVEFEERRVDLPAIGRYLASRVAVLGSQSSMPPTPLPTNSAAQIGEPGLISKLLDWLGDDYHQCDPDELDAQLHGESSMLLPEERVQMGFVCGRDTVVLTTHRALKLDKQGLTGQKVLYLSLPWTRVKAWEVESAGSWDLEATLKLTIESAWYNREIGSGLAVDFRKGRADVLAIDKFISAQVIGARDGSSSLARELLPARQEGLIGQFLGWLGNDYRQIPREEVTEKLTSDPDLLLPDEAVDIAFRCGRDLMVLTTKRALKIDVKGSPSPLEMLTGSDDQAKRVNYRSLPWGSAKCFYVKGNAQTPFDMDCEVFLQSDAGPWAFDVRTGQGDITAVYTLCSQKLMPRAAVPNRAVGLAWPEQGGPSLASPC